MSQDLEQKIFSKINSLKHKSGRKSIIAGMQTSYNDAALPNKQKEINDTKDTKSPKQKKQEHPFDIQTKAKPSQTKSNKIESNINIEAEILAKFDLMLMHKVASLENVLTSIENKVDKIQPRLQIEVDNTQILSKVEKVINQSLDKSISGIKNSLSMSINYYNNELFERQKKFNEQHEETARVAIENHKSTINLKGQRGETDFKRLEERIKLLMRSENKCEDILGKIDRQLVKMSDNIRDFNEGFVLDSNFKSIQGDELIEMSEQELLEMILENYQIKFDSPEMKDYIYQEIGVKQGKRK